MALKRDIKYLNRDFESFRQALITYAQTYFPNTYNDFTPASPGTMFLEMSSYVGDVLSFYLDNQVQETFIQYAQQDSNIFSLAYTLGYFPKVTTAAQVQVDIYQQVPSGSSGADLDYALVLGENSVLSNPNDSNIAFLLRDKVDFSINNQLDPTTSTVYQVDSSGTPTRFLLKKTKTAISAQIATLQVDTPNTPQDYFTTLINEENIIGVLDIVDSDGNVWYEVDYLAQSTIVDSEVNTNSSSEEVPSLLRLEQVQRKFISRFIDRNTLQLQFGAGSPSDTTEEIIPNPNNIGSPTQYGRSKLTTAYNPNNFLQTTTYGIAPSNTTLTIRYLTGGGVESNIPANRLTVFTGDLEFKNEGLDPTTANSIFTSLQVNNPQAAVGGSDGDSVEEIRENSLKAFTAQMRTLTADDYLIRAYALPPEFGVVSQVYVEKATQSASQGTSNSLDMFILGQDVNGYLTQSSNELKRNLKTYLSQYRALNDSINIRDAFVINLGVDFEIVSLPNYNSNEVLLNCITALQNYFDTSNWQINQPIILRNITVLLDGIEGVQTIKNISFENKVGESLGYSKYAYDVDGALIDGVLYPSQDPMIFEVKYKDRDITGRVSNI